MEQEAEDIDIYFILQVDDYCLSILEVSLLQKWFSSWTLSHNHDFTTFDILIMGLLFFFARNPLI